MELMMQLKELTLSDRLTTLLKEIILFANTLRQFSWTRQGINNYLLSRSARLFDIQLHHSQLAGRVTKQKRKIMRSLKYQTTVKKRSLLAYVRELFRPKSSSGGEIQQRRRRPRENPFSRNVMRHH